jgi:hypothetical protein
MTIVNQEAAIQIDRIAAETIRVPIVGTSPLIVHNFSEKSKRQMLEAQQGKKRLKEARDPQAEFEAAFYRIIDPTTGELSYGFPVTAFKAATVGAARFYGKDISMTALRQLLFMRGVLTEGDPQQLVRIVGEPRMREDVVRLGGPSRSADLRYRPEFPVWSTVLEVTYITSSISRQSVLSLIDAGGLGIGVGEWRPEKRGEFGTYAVDQSKQVEVLS